ncbi:MAG TPA: cofactor-independent phosphoglycerate mutase [Armatimonadaceae bacterium]|nr:cofactor-independent phosphoglycerate mutase [Armatimonadaceae bacterium]
MKYVLLVPDGAADDPIAELDGKTPLEYARTPNLDDLARRGQVGSVLTVPEGMYPGSDVANMSLLGYEPVKHYTGRGPLEAAALEVPLSERDVAFRCSLVSTDGETLLDYSSGHVETEDARVLMALVQEKLGSRRYRFFPGVSYRHILRVTDGSVDVKTTPPHDIQGKPLAPYLPTGDDESGLRSLVFDSLELLDAHPINRRRRDEGHAPANTLWPWGQGRATVLPAFFASRGLSGAVITAVDLLRGLGRCAAMKIVDVPGATGYIDTNYLGKAQYGLGALDAGADFLYLHVESPDESGHEGNTEHKVRSIEDIDRMVVGPLVEGFKKRGQPFRLMVVPDHATPLALRTHRSGPVPFLLYDSKRERDGKLPYDERALEETRLVVEEGHRLIELLLND